MELPDDDGGLEVRAGHRRRQHRRAQAERHDARDHAADGRDRGRSSCRRACSTSSPATATPAARWSSTRRRPWSRSPARSGPACRSRPSAAKDVKRVHLELGGKAPVVVFDDADIAAAAEAIAVAGYFNAGQDCTAATRVLAGPGIHDDFVAAPGRAGQGGEGRPAGRRGRPAGPGQQRQPAGPRHRLPRPAARPRLDRRRRHRGSTSSATATTCSRPSSRACSRTTR